MIHSLHRIISFDYLVALKRADVSSEKNWLGAPSHTGYCVAMSDTILSKHDVPCLPYRSRHMNSFR